MGLVSHCGRILRPILSLVEIRSGPTVHTFLDPSRADSHSIIAACKRELELDFLPEERSLVELCLFCALPLVGFHSRGSSTPNARSALNLGMRSTRPI